MAHKPLPKGTRRQPAAIGSARRLRKDATKAERLLWHRLKASQVCGYKFRRQYAIGPCIADFCCAGERLIIELDGSHHGLQDDANARRSQWLNQQGYRVVRYTNEQVYKHLNDVVRDIEGHLLKMKD